MKINIRNAENADIPFLLNSWLMSYRNSGQMKLIPNDVYFGEYADIVKILLNNANILIACDPSDENHIYGFLAYKLIHVANGNSIFISHYAYTKHSYRNLGVMKLLVNKAFPNFKKEEFVATHVNHLISSKRDKYRLVYNPFFKEALNENFIN